MAEHLVRERDEARRELAMLRLQQQLDAAARAKPARDFLERPNRARWSGRPLRATLD